MKSTLTQTDQEELILHRLPVGQLETNCYIVGSRSSNKALILDPGDDSEYILNRLRDLNLIPIKVIATHGHFDHILAVWELVETLRIPFLMHPGDKFLTARMRETARYFLGREIVELPPKISQPLTEGNIIRLGNIRLEVIETPGHTPGSICLYIKSRKCMFTGDTIFAQGVGRIDFSYSSGTHLKESIAKILNFPDNFILYPGHGEATTIAKEKEYHKS